MNNSLRALEIIKREVLQSFYKVLGGISMFQGKILRLFVSSLFIVSIILGMSISYADSSSEKKIDQAWDLYIEGDYNKAVKLLDEVLSVDSGNQEAYYLRGTAYCHLENYPRAIQDLNKALELDPEDAMAYNERGDAYYYLHKYDNAINDYNQAIKLNPNEADYYANRALAYYGSDQYAKSLADINKALELEPDSSYFQGIRDDIKSDMESGGGNEELRKKIIASIKEKLKKR